MFNPFKNGMNKATRLTPLPSQIGKVRNVCYIAGKFNGEAANKKYANDEGTGHPHALAVNCKVNPDCANKTCENPCGEFKETGVNGHFTHTPPVDKQSVKVGDTDANGDPRPQFFVLSKEKPTIPGDELNKLLENGDIKYNQKVSDYINADKNIIDKIK
jgi:hypothetical protein